MKIIAQVLVGILLSTHSVWSKEANSQRNQPVQKQVKTQDFRSQSASSNAAHVQEQHSSDSKSTRWPENRESSEHDSNLMRSGHGGGRSKRAAALAAVIPAVGEFLHNIFQGSSKACMTEAQMERKLYEYKILLTSGAKQFMGLPAVLMLIGVSLLHVLGFQKGG